ncbi:hypothetical protein CFT9_07626 [Pseudomonas sp. CFT9]|nr:hypothetical protein CFT9_07626 [Pseudomonas sp. CFT9]
MGLYLKLFQMQSKDSLQFMIICCLRMMRIGQMLSIVVVVFFRMLRMHFILRGKIRLLIQGQSRNL